MRVAGHQPRRRLGQHFLREPGVLRAIVAALAPEPGERIVEIGPGLGALTFAVLERCQRLDVVELDRDLARRLQDHPAARAGRLVVHQADALRIDLSTLAGQERLRVIGNLPYNISTPLLFRLLEQADVVRDLHLMLQSEVVDRLTARPGGKTWGRLGVMVQLRCQTERLFDVPPEAFAPPPKVGSAVVRLTPLRAPRYPLTDPRDLDALVRQAFGQRRKTLRRSLKGHLDEAAIAATGVDPGARPETLTLAQVVALANALSQGPRRGP